MPKNAFTKFEGIVTPLLSPLDKNERLIAKDLAKLVRYQIKSGVQALLAPSGSGECFALPDDERQRLVEIVVEAAAGKIPVIAMTADCGTRKVLKHIEAARKAGADGVMVPPVYYTVIDQAVLKSFFLRLADESGLPLWLYQQPQETKLTLEPATIAELARHPNIVGIKISHGADMLDYHRVVRATRDNPDFSVLMGEDINDLSGWVLGGHGGVCTLANIIPEEFIGLWHAVKRGDLATARQLQDRIMDVCELLILNPRCFQSACKLVLQKRGIFSTAINTHPLPALDAAGQKKILTEGKKLGLF